MRLHPACRQACKATSGPQTNVSISLPPRGTHEKTRSEPKIAMYSVQYPTQRRSVTKEEEEKYVIPQITTPFHAMCAMHASFRPSQQEASQLNTRPACGDATKPATVRAIDHCQK